MSVGYGAGDQVELITPLPHRPKLPVGKQGVVLIGSADAPWGLLTVSFRVYDADPVLIHPRHVRLVARARAEV